MMVEFVGAFRDLCTERGINLHNTFSEKKSTFREKNIVYRYLEEKWTYSYPEKLDAFVKTIISSVNWTKKLS